MSKFLHGCPPPSLVRVEGEDALDYLQSQLTIDLVKLGQDKIRYGLRLDKRGKTMAGMYVIKDNAESFWLISRGSKANDLISLIEENLVADDVELIDESSAFFLITARGKEEQRVLDRLGLHKPKPGKIERSVESIAFIDSRLPPTTYSIILRKDQKSQAMGDSKSMDWEMIEVPRIESCLVAIPEEIGANDLPQEGNLEHDYIDFTKGCYLGQEVMARIHAMGNVRRKAYPIRFTSSMVPSLPCPLLSDGKKVGILKSALKEKDGFIGIAILHEKGFAVLGDNQIEIAETKIRIKAL
tara:strand:+ start:2771 stop:3664 length:894 start_codon:yes stop_codon:yes gene_type:complete